MTVELSGPLRGPLRKRESHLWARHPDDFYIEPLWVSARLFDQERFEGGIHDPACGAGNIVISARAAGYLCTASDILDRADDGLHIETRDWLTDSFPVSNIVSNPPFGLCDDRKSKSHPFVQRCLERAERKVALLMPSNWIQGDARSRWLETTPLRCVYFISPRPSMPPGPALQAGMKPGNGTTDYAFFVWLRGYDGRPEIRYLRRDA